MSGAREGEAESETKSWKCRSSEGARGVVFITYARKKLNAKDTQLKKNGGMMNDGGFAFVSGSNVSRKRSETG